MFVRPPSHSRMKTLRYLDPDDYMTVCVALRDVYAEVKDPALLKKLRYAEALAHTIVEKLNEYDPKWLRQLYPKRKNYEKIMEGK